VIGESVLGLHWERNNVPLLLHYRHSSARFIKFRVFSKSDVTTVAFPHGKVAIYTNLSIIIRST